MKWYKLIIIGISIILIIGLCGSLADIWSKRDVVGIREEKLIKIKKEHEVLKKKLEETKTSAFIEREARERLGLVQPGETIVLFDKNGQSEIVEKGDAIPSMPKWKQWWQLFF